MHNACFQGLFDRALRPTANLLRISKYPNIATNIHLIRIRKAIEQDGVSVTDFIRSAPMGSNELLPIIDQAIDSISNSEIKAIVSSCYEKVKDKMESSPAAKLHHHAYFGGLAFHVVRMLELGDFICRQRPFLNSDLVKAGIYST